MRDSGRRGNKLKLSDNERRGGGVGKGKGSANPTGPGYVLMTACTLGKV